MASIISAGTTSGTSLNLSADTSGVLQLATNGTTTAITIDTSQNVGIGTASPSYKLDVLNNASTVAVRVKNSNATSKNGIQFDNYVSTASGSVYYDNANAAFTVGGDTGVPTVFNSAGTERMRITSTGEVGIGKSSYTSMTTDGFWFVKGAFTQISNTDNGNATLYLNQNGTGLIQEWRLANAVKGTFNQYGLGLGTAVPSSGAGITFPATQSATSDANTLDDYEEGTFNPDVIGSSTAGTVSFSVRIGRYTKIGNRVLFHIYLVYSGGTGSGNLRVTGLPFTASSVTNNIPALSIGLSNITLPASSVCWAYVADNSTTIVMSSYPAGGGAAAAVSYDAAGDILLAGHYEV